MQPDRNDITNHLSSLSIAPSFRHLPETDLQKLTRLVLLDLASKEPVLRLTASRALAIWGRGATISDLETALNSETDETVNAQMKRDLAILSEQQKKNPQ